MTIESKPDRSAVGTMSTERLPIVDIGPYLDESATDEDRRKARDALDSACREFGESWLRAFVEYPGEISSCQTTKRAYVAFRGRDPRPGAYPMGHR
jgi:hypothetical protein